MYATFSTSHEPVSAADVTLDNGMWAKLAKVCGLVSGPCTSSDVDIVFSQVRNFRNTTAVSIIGMLCSTGTGSVQCESHGIVVPSASASQLPTLSFLAYPAGEGGWEAQGQL